ncbi:MAG: ankyrin repeat protein, partial [Arcticibacterium sp.]
MIKDPQKNMDFFNLIRQGDIEGVKAALMNDAVLLEKKDERGFTPLVMATYSGHLDLSEFLINTGAQVNATDS